MLHSLIWGDGNRSMDGKEIKEMGQKTKRQISDPYLAAFLFLNLKQKPLPTIDVSGRVSFEFPDDEKTDSIIKRYHEDEVISAFSFATAIKSVKSMIFSFKGRAVNGPR